MRSFGWTGEEVAQDTGIYRETFCPAVMWPVTPLWLLETPNVDLELLGTRPKTGEADVICQFQDRVEEKYRSHVIMFMDGSKDQATGATGAAFLVCGMNVRVCKRTSNSLSVFTVELFAILMVVQWAGQLEDCEVLVCSDSMSAVKSIGMGSARGQQDLVYEVLLALRDVARRGVRVSFMWEPAHVGIGANERVDRLAKEAVKRELVDVKLNLSKSEGKSVH
ncbi:hypothetical protein PFLUV_G00147380 [Xyrichtys novacula]|uniref:RNase H type-1 domain-containing protein n=1 Tax=Xyrichtys novacula TaxID=13765 RepID=A0AAV1EPY4_XYRNO|nr:hypothetical protein PFLUV_G00147380 [Xyrichtys novacula]